MSIEVMPDPFARLLTNWFAASHANNPCLFPFLLTALTDQVDQTRSDMVALARLRMTVLAARIAWQVIS